MQYVAQLESILDAASFKLSGILPSEWAESHRVMTTDVSPFPGPFRYNKSPYLREIVDCLAPSHPARIVAVMKGAQIGFSAGVIENGIGYIISEQPGNILFLSGHAELSEEAMNTKVDQMIDSCGLRPMIKPNVLRKRNARTGDTNKSKEFPGGSLVSGGANNHKLLRQRSIRYAFIDDYDAVKRQSKESGSTTTLIEQRLAAYYQKMKLFYISTPELRSISNIEPVFNLGDKRKYNIPCYHCGEYIPLEWDIEIEGEDGERAGIYWKTDSIGKLVPGSVGYICQKCGGFFNDSNKLDQLQVGGWKPTAEPSEEGYYSYHISSLYAPPGMYDWEYYVRQYIKANPQNAPRIEAEHKSFLNLCLGLPYEETGTDIKANHLQKNIMGYSIGTVPEKLSQKHGNGNIILITSAWDLNGVVDDARIDYEIVAWSETGSSYSLMHGSVGTFIPRENTLAHKQDRQAWTYEMHKSNSVWSEVAKILNTKFTLENGRQIPVMITGIDTGHYDAYVWDFIDKHPEFIIYGLKGQREGKYNPFDQNKSLFTKSKSRPDKLFILETNLIKDELAKLISLAYDDRDDSQPAGFMNFPVPSDGLYLYTNYFSHYEAEHRVIKETAGKPSAATWQKKSSSLQNHLFDCRCYNLVLREIWAAKWCEAFKIKPATWDNYVASQVK